MLEHITFEEFTSMDKNMDTLIKVRAHCLFLKATHACGHPCSVCEEYKKYMACYQSLAWCDQLKVDHEADRLFAHKMMSYRLLRRNRIQMRVIRGVLFAVLAVMLVLVAVDKAHGQPMPQTPYYYYKDAFIVSLLKETQSQVEDVNFDGDINCIDYAVTFKELWDRRYPAGRCEILRNLNRATGWHHLFISIKVGRWLYIEPQGNAHNYRMSDFWGARYDSAYTVYVETSRWLEEDRREKR